MKKKYDIVECNRLALYSIFLNKNQRGFHCNCFNTTIKNMKHNVFIANC